MSVPLWKCEVTGKPVYYNALICENGHVVSPWIDDHPGLETTFCSICGTKTLRTCPKCGQPIRGIDRYTMTDYIRPAYCSDCGLAFPWTVSAIEAVKELAARTEMEVMDRTELPDLIESLVRQTPRTPVAALRMKGLLDKVGPLAAEGFKQILIGVVTEGAKKMVWPSA
jgi:hypothetical protein